MTMIQIQLPFDTLLSYLQQLNAQELAQLVQHAARLQAQRRAPSLSQVETELLLNINQSVVPLAILQRCAELTKQQRTQRLSTKEQAELMTLVDEIELINAKRLGYLAELATIRQTTPEELMRRLGVNAITYG